jgi:tripartite-type tricarboxylate transporter receptor subunit TctC
MQQRAHRQARSTRMRVVLAICAVLGFPVLAAAEDYPSRPIRLLVGFTAGGPTDVPARFLADRLSGLLGKPVVVENKPGAGAMLAANELLSQPRNGYNLLLCTYFDAVNTLLYRSVKYKLSDILGISLIAKYSYAVAVSNAIPAQSFNQLIEYTKEHPDRVNYGHLGVGSTQNLLAKKLEKLTGMKMTAIPYKGSPEAMQEIVAGRNHLYIGPPLGVMPMYETKQIKVLAVTGDERLPSMPEGAHAEGKRNSFHGVCLARRMRWIRNAAADRGSSQQPNRASGQLGGISIVDRQVGIHCGVLEPAAIS